MVFGVTVAGRPPEIAGIESMVGLFINTLPLRVKLAPEQPLAVLLSVLQDSQSRLMAHQHLGLAEIQSLAGLGELFDTLVVFENYPVDQAALANAGNGLRVTPIAGHDVSHYPLSLGAMPGEQLRLRLDYRPDLFDRASIEALGERLVRLLEAAVAEPDRAIGRLDILGAAERQTLLRDWNDTVQPIAFATVAELFAAQAARTPEAVAVVFEEQQLTYGQLEERANRLAHHLRGLGVGPEVVVGLCVERSLQMVVGLLGILKAGGAYLPLDPGYPPERLAFMLEDSPGAGAADAIGLAPTPCRASRLPSLSWMPIGPRSRGSRRARRATPSRRTTPPTSSTPQDRPETPKASPLRIRILSDLGAPKSITMSILARDAVLDFASFVASIFRFGRLGSAAPSAGDCLCAYAISRSTR